MGSAQGLTKAKPEEEGFSSERLARIGAIMQRHIDKQEVPGVVTLIARHGKIVHFEAQGFRNLDDKLPMRKDTIFRIASMTKPVTSVAVLMLYEEGHFTLDDPISKFIPAFKSPEVVMEAVSPVGRSSVPMIGTLALVPAAREITIRDCLTHTAGFATARSMPIALLGRYLQAMRGTPALAMMVPELARGAPEAPAMTVGEMAERLAKMPLSFHPGTKWEYGQGHNVAGVLVEIVSGKTLDEFFRERIFEPLGMPDTYFYIPENKLSRLVTLHTKVEDNGGWHVKVAVRNEDTPQVKGPRVAFAGGGGLISTAADYARFAQMLLNGGVLDGVRLLSRKTVELMTTNHTGDLPIYLVGPGYGFGLGVFVLKDLGVASTLGSIGTYGWGGAFTTLYFADPKEDMFGLYFTQIQTGGRELNSVLGVEFQRLTYQALVD